MCFIATPSRGERIIRAGLQSLMILLGVVTLTFGVYRLQSAFTVDRSESDSSALTAAGDQGFVPVLDTVPPSELAPSSSQPGSASLLQRQMEMEELLGAETGSQPTGADVSLVHNRPVRLLIPEINLEAPVVSAPLLTGEIDGQRVHQWAAPDSFAAGWHYESAEVGERGNTVINGHHNAFGEVFRNLHELENGDLIFVYGNENTQTYRYEVTQVIILKERFQPLEVRADNARWIQTTDDERLTLITCWPYESNTHRLIVVARPVDAADGSVAPQMK
ncbi:MAG: sortase [Anaerolineales bacterium]|nr:sortase [Anaerolineales bacterium]